MEAPCKEQVRPSGTCSFALAEATFLDACQMESEASFCKFQKAALRSEGGHPSTRSVLQGHAALHWRRQAPGPSFRDMQFCAGGGYFFGRSARGFGASFCNVSKGNVRQWRRPSKQRVRPSGTCGFALAEATFLVAWQVDLELVFVEFQIATCQYRASPGFDLELVFVTFQKAMLGSKWRRLSKHQVRPSGTCSFALTWQEDLELVFGNVLQKATLGSGGGHPGTRSVLQGHAALH